MKAEVGARKRLNMAKLMKPKKFWKINSLLNDNFLSKRFGSTSLGTIGSLNQQQFCTTKRSGKHSKSHPKQYKKAICALFLGAPGVGKGTYSHLIAPQFNARVLSSGDLLREAIKKEKEKNPELSSTLLKIMNDGGLIDDDIVIPMVINYLRTLTNSFILDGFPRTLKQSETINTYYGVDIAIHFQLPHHILINKLTGRRVCIDMPKCHGNFNVADINEGDIVMPSMMPKVEGKCDICGKDLIQRKDDTEKVIAERLRSYYEQIIPIANYFKESGVLLEYNVKKGIDDVPDIVDKMRAFLDHNFVR